MPIAIYRPFILCICTLLLSGACASDKKRTVEETTPETGATPPGGSSGEDPGEPSDVSGVGEGGLPIFNDALPADCNTCRTTNANTVAGCPTTVGTSAACRGFCFVNPNVALSFADNPPTSGPMYPTPTFAPYEHTEVLPRGTWIHNLSHGYVVVLYNCPSGCDAELQQLRNTMFTNDYLLAGLETILTPDPLLPAGNRFYAVSWTWSYSFDSIDPNAISCFTRQHVLHGYPHVGAPPMSP